MQEGLSRGWHVPLPGHDGALARLARAAAGCRWAVDTVRRGTAEYRWGLVVTAVFLYLALWVYWVTPQVHVPSSDGFYSWMFARSLAFDLDVDFANDYAQCGDPFGIGADRGSGRPDNIFYPGPALFWVPIIWVLRWLAFDASGTTTCGGAWTRLALGASPFVGAATTYLSYSVARRYSSDGVAALSAATVAFGGPLFKFSSALPSYSHAYDALCVAALVAATLWAADGPGSGRWIWVAVAMAGSVMQRLSNTMFIVVPFTIACVSSWNRPRRLLSILAVTSLGGAVGAAALGAIYQYLYGSAFVFTHGPYFLHLAHAHPLLLLFDTEEGLLFHAPGSWLALLGAVSALRSRRSLALVGPLLIVSGAELILSSAALDWAPARRLTNLTLLMVLLVAHPLEQAYAFFVRDRRAIVLAGVLAVLPTIQGALGYAWGYPRGLIPSERPLTQGELYGGSSASFWRLVDRTMASPAVWPAQAIFWMRYGLPMAEFGNAAFPYWYLRDFRSLRWHNREVELSDSRLRKLMAGMVASADGAHLSERRARVVFSIQWPFVTHLVLRASASNCQGSVRVGARRFFGPTRWFGERRALQDGWRDYEFSVPPEAMSSGINEIVFEVEGCDPADVVLRHLHLDDRRRLLPVVPELAGSR